MKSSLMKFAAPVLLTLHCLQGYAVDMADLTLTPAQECKKPPKAPPYKLLHKEYRSYSITTNGPFDHTVDINGDGWCDWVSRPWVAPHRGDIDEPQMKDFIFLGTSTG